MANTGLLGDQTAFQYYSNSAKFIGDGSTVDFVLDIQIGTPPTSTSEFIIYLDGTEVMTDVFSYNSTTKTITFDTAPDLSSEILVYLINAKHGGYRYIAFQDIIDNFLVSYVGDNKLIQKANTLDVAFHAKRAIQEFSYDILRIEKIQEVEVGPTLVVPMPQDYVDLVQVAWVDNYGQEHPIPRGRLTSKPSEAPFQDGDYGYGYDSQDGLLTLDPIINERWKDQNGGNVTDLNDSNDAARFTNAAFGSDPELMNSNGMYIIDELNGKITFSSNLVGNVITIKYVSDSLGTDNEMKVHKFAEEAIYKHIAYAIASSYITTPEYIVNRLRRERRAAMRNAKLRIQNYSLSEMTQVMRGKSKQIKH